MYPICTFIEDLYEHLTGRRSVTGSIIRKHTKKLDQLGDISFPLNIKNWSQVTDKARLTDTNTIFDYLLPGDSLNTQLDTLIQASRNWSLIVDTYKVKDDNVHLFLHRPHTIRSCITHILKERGNYGLQYKCFHKKLNITYDEVDVTKMGLTELRLSIISDVISNITNALTDYNSEGDCMVKITTNSKNKLENAVLCGSILNESGCKDTQTTASELYKKRALDMQLMAQHKYGVQLKPSWFEYFHKLGKASVTIEMLQNKVHKSIKVTLNNLQTANKCPSFIFYNCARISSLLKQLDDKVSNRTYPEVPPIDTIDFTLLNQAEEWEMVFVYLLQFPSIVVSCVSDIQLGVVNLHYLISFLANLSSVFSVYYRRVKVLTIAKEHLLPVLYARIYLIQAIQQVFHTALHLLNIEPVKEM